MSIQIALNGNDPRRVELARSGDQSTVWIEGIPCPVSIVDAGGAAVIEIEGRAETIYTVTDGDTVFVHAFGRSWTLVVTDPVESAIREGQVSDAAVAPMPGVLVSIGVSPGDEVTKGQVIAVIESMKMQTQISAPRDGVVDRVLVDVGNNFEGGAALVTLLPDDDEAIDGEED